MSQTITMTQYGLTETVEKSAEQFAGLTVSRVLSQEKGVYRLVSAQGEKWGEVSGRFQYGIQLKSEYPAVGDFVMADWNQCGGNAVIHHVLPRKSRFVRKAAGEKVEEQVVAANIDTVFLCMSLNNDFNLRRLERYVSIAWNSGAMPVVVLTKSDLCEEPEKKLAEVSSVAVGVDIVVTNTITQNGYAQIYPYLAEGKTIAFIGSSGVGKSTLINCLLGEKHLETNGLRNDDKGRHTTTRRELILLPAGGMVIDTPGMEFTELVKVLRTITDPRAESIVHALTASLQRMIDIGLPYLSMDRESSTLSGGEAQRLKLVRYMGSSLTGMTYIFDEPSTGMHPRDVYRMTRLLQSLRDRGNTVLVVEHDRDVIAIADEIIDVGPLAGKNGGQILFQGSYEALLFSGTRTGNAMKHTESLKEQPRTPKRFLPVQNASVHNLKHVSVDIPLNVLTVVTGVAGSGKSSLIRDVFAKQYADQVVLVDQSPVTATGRSTPATFLGFFDEIRHVIAKENGVDAGLFSFNSKGACPACSGRGQIVTELVFMDPVTTVCEACEGKRYSQEAMSFPYKGKNIVEILDMSAGEAYEFFRDNSKLQKALGAMLEVGLPYLSLGQPLSTLSGGERQRVKLAKDLYKKGNIYLCWNTSPGSSALRSASSTLIP